MSDSVTKTEIRVGWIPWGSDPDAVEILNVGQSTGYPSRGVAQKVVERYTLEDDLMGHGGRQWVVVERQVTTTPWVRVKPESQT